MTASQHLLIEKIAALPPQRLAEVEDFVDFLRARDEAQEHKRDSRLTTDAARASPRSRRYGTTTKMRLMIDCSQSRSWQRS